MRNSVAIKMGHRFGKLVVIGDSERIYCDNYYYTRYLTKCDCGNILYVRKSNLLSGTTKSCGCLRSQLLTSNATSHGMSKHRLYHIWTSMKNRCLNTECNDYGLYGGRGIVIYEKWQHSFVDFFDFVSQLPHYGEHGYSLDRINNDGNYEPNNIRWADNSQQRLNQRIAINNKTGYVGIYLRNDNHKFVSTITVHGLNHYLGTHDTIDDAVLARNNFIIKENLMDYKIQYTNNVTEQ